MKRILSLLLAIVMCLGLLGCRKNVEEELNENEIPAENGVINLQMRDPDILDPILTEKKSVRDGLLCVYEPLFNITENFGLEKVLAEEYVFNESATIMTVKLKEGVLWHNNHLLTADDVIYTVEKIKKAPSGPYYLNLSKMDRVEKISDYQVAFYLSEPYALFAYNLYFPIMHVGTDTGEIVGTGAYCYSETDGKQLVLTKNTAWHMGHVSNDGVKFIYMKTGAMAQEAFSSGKIHAVTEDVLDTENFAIKESNKKYTYPNGLFEFMGFNHTNGIFSDPALRQAATSAIDRNVLSEIFGDGISASFPIMSGSEAFSPIFESVNYGADYAREIIFYSGWNDTDADGKPEKIIDGEVKTLDVNLLVSNRENVRCLVAAKVKEQLENAGFVVNMDIVDIEEYNSRVSKGEFDLFLGAMYYESPYDFTELLSSYGKVNYTGYKNSAMDEALEQFCKSVDIDTSTVAFSRIQALYKEHVPVGGITFRSSYVLTSSSIEGEVTPYPYNPYAGINNWMVK